MNRVPSPARLSRRTALATLAGAAGALVPEVGPAALSAQAASDPAGIFALNGFNVIQSQSARFDGPEAARSLERVALLGAKAVSIIPFLWQETASSTKIVRGSDMTDEQLRAALRLAHGLGLKTVVKPHVWVPGGWAGQVDMGSDARWSEWFQAFREALVPLARLAAEVRADGFVVGTELRKSVGRPEWPECLAAIRDAFPGRLSYVAHGADDAEAVPFWPLLDAVGVSMYPVLGPADAPAAWHKAMDGETARVLARARAVDRPVWVAEVGIRSCAGATLRPWESPEERVAEPDDGLQARVLEAWLDRIGRESGTGAMIWCWYTDMRRGGPLDTDFTPRGKLLEGLLAGRWAAASCPRGSVLPSGWPAGRPSAPT